MRVVSLCLFVAALSLSHGDSPITRVVVLIEGLKSKIIADGQMEQAVYDKYACWCEKTTGRKASAIEAAKASIDSLSNDIKELKGRLGSFVAEVAGLEKNIAETQASITKTEKLRKNENEEFLSDKASLEQGIANLEKAIQVLREFYGKQEASAALLQRQDSRAKEPYTGMGSSSGGVLGLLDVILSDFARLETETSAAEDQAASAFEKFMSESTQDKEVKETELEHSKNRKDEAEEMLRTDKKELKLTQEELDKALDYYDKLKEDCLDTGMSYEDRVRAREEEIQSLKEALKILSGEDIA